MGKRYNNAVEQKDPLLPATINCQYHMHLPTHFTYGGNDYSLFKGENYNLPDCSFVRSMIKQKRLSIETK